MKTLNASEAADWCKSRGISLDNRGMPSITDKGISRRRFQTPSQVNRQNPFCHLIEHFLRPWKNCLLWVTEWSIWESSENWHLYYRLRQSYGDNRLIEEAPAHLFFDYESSDLISFLQVGLSMGWDMHLLTQEDYARVFISHDEWIEFAMRDSVELDRLTAELKKAM